MGGPPPTPITLPEATEALNEINDELALLTKNDNHARFTLLEGQAKKLTDIVVRLTRQEENEDNGAQCSRIDQMMGFDPFDIRNYLARVSIPIVELDEGACNYVLITVMRRKQVGLVRIVRSSAAAKYHFEAATLTVKALKKAGLEAEINGGGTILKKGNSVEISGRSYEYGKGDHELAAAVVRKELPTADVKWEDDGCY